MNHDHLPAGRRALDHVAIRVVNRDAFADQLLDHFDWRVIDRTDRFTLIGPDFEHGKVTLLDAEPDGQPVATRLVSLVLVELAGRPVPAPVHLDNGLVVTFTSAERVGMGASRLPRHALIGLVLRSSDPEAAADSFAAQHGMRVISRSAEVAAVEVGENAAAGMITLLREAIPAGPSLLDHVGVLVDDAAAWRDAFEAEGGPIDRWVEAAHSRAVFVPGPDDVLIEFVEQLAPMSAV